MRLIFIGTSHGVPEPHRRCSSYILECGGCYYLIDMGTQVIEDLHTRGISVGSVRLVICTHPHGDHTDGLISFVDLINWYYKTANPKILLPDARLIPPLKQWLTVNSNGKPPREDLQLGVFSEGIVFEDENLRVTAIRTQHCENSYALFLEVENRKLMFTGDLCRPSVDFPEIAFKTELDLLVCETAHFSPEDCIPFFDRTNAKRIIHSHIYDSRWAGVLSDQMKTPHPYEYAAAFDGMEILL